MQAADDLNRRIAGTNFRLIAVDAACYILWISWASWQIEIADDASFLVERIGRHGRQGMVLGGYSWGRSGSAGIRLEDERGDVRSAVCRIQGLGVDRKRLHINMLK